ncbi:hypothetical protein A2U01_0091751, partial [Trifolium medium]|nr:hypothetical protein [Trifolium medium]
STLILQLKTWMNYLHFFKFLWLPGHSTVVAK